MSRNLSVRELEKNDVAYLVDYWTKSESSFMESMGVDLKKLPTGDQLSTMLFNQLDKPVHERMSYCIIWLLDGQPVGHCNTNPTLFGEEAAMHLHLWYNRDRKSGLGSEFLKKTLPYFFENLKLKRLYSEPYALNEAPNKTLAKTGFELIKEYVTTPGFLNFEQPVKRWELTADKYNKK
jgi:RimJ/RimL family protein N-acetyltransferase